MTTTCVVWSTSPSYDDAGRAGSETTSGSGWSDGAGAPSTASSTRMSDPSDTRSSSATRRSVTLPALGAGMSIVALSDSSVTSGSSGATSSPTATWISMTGTSSKSPMSGTFTSRGDI